MARPDLYLIAALELNGTLPSALAKKVVECYDTPSPINYDTALAFMDDAFGEVVAESGVLDLTDDDFRGQDDDDDDDDEESTQQPVDRPLQYGPAEIPPLWEMCVPCRVAVETSGPGLAAMAAIKGVELGIGTQAGMRVVIYEFHKADHK